MRDGPTRIWRWAGSGLAAQHPARRSAASRRARPQRATGVRRAHSQHVGQGPGGSTRRRGRDRPSACRVRDSFPEARRRAPAKGDHPRRATHRDRPFDRRLQVGKRERFAHHHRVFGRESRRARSDAGIQLASPEDRREARARRGRFVRPFVATERTSDRSSCAGRSLRPRSRTHPVRTGHGSGD